MSVELLRPPHFACGGRCSGRAWRPRRRRSGPATPASRTGCGDGLRHPPHRHDRPRRTRPCSVSSVRCPVFEISPGQVLSLRALPHTSKTRDGVVGLPRASWAGSMACQVPIHSTDSAYAGSAYPGPAGRVSGAFRPSTQACQAMSSRRSNFNRRGDSGKARPRAASPACAARGAPAALPACSADRPVRCRPTLGCGSTRAPKDP